MLPPSLSFEEVAPLAVLRGSCTPCCPLRNLHPSLSFEKVGPLAVLRGCCTPRCPSRKLHPSLSFEEVAPLAVFRGSCTPPPCSVYGMLLCCQQQELSFIPGLVTPHLQWSKPLESSVMDSWVKVSSLVLIFCNLCTWKTSDNHRQHISKLSPQFIRPILNLEPGSLMFRSDINSFK